MEKQRRLLRVLTKDAQLLLSGSMNVVELTALRNACNALLGGRNVVKIWQLVRFAADGKTYLFEKDEWDPNEPHDVLWEGTAEELGDRIGSPEKTS